MNKNKLFYIFQTVSMLGCYLIFLKYDVELDTIHIEDSDSYLSRSGNELDKGGQDIKDMIQLVIERIKEEGSFDIVKVRSGGQELTF